MRASPSYEDHRTLLVEPVLLLQGAAVLRRAEDGVNRDARQGDVGGWNAEVLQVLRGLLAGDEVVIGSLGPPRSLDSVAISAVFLVISSSER